MKLIFLNTWHAHLHKELRDYIARHSTNTDVFCFTEADRHSRNVYADLLANNFTAHSTQRHMLETGGRYGNVIYVRNTFDIRDSGSLFMDEARRIGIGLANYVVLKAAKGNITVCNMHGVYSPGDKLDSDVRLYQTTKLIERFADHEKVVIAGDFNLLPETKSVQLFREHGYQDLVRDYAIKTTRNRHTFDRYPDNIQYYADYAFVSPTLKVERFTVPEDVVSDHQPLELEIEVE